MYRRDSRKYWRVRGDNWQTLYCQIYHSIFQITGYYGGVSDTKHSEYESRFNRSLIYAILHKRIITRDVYCEKDLEETIVSCKEEVALAENFISGLLTRHNMEFLIPPAAQDNEIDLKAKFSFKDAAANSGIGWIGENDLLITAQYGPRVRLGATILNLEIELNKGSQDSRCAEDCALCITACPYSLLQGRQWKLGMGRKDLIDHHKCNDYRSKYIKPHGRKNACGLCLVSCPIGTSQSKN